MEKEPQKASASEISLDMGSGGGMTRNEWADAIKELSRQAAPRPVKPAAKGTTPSSGSSAMVPKPASAPIPSPEKMLQQVIDQSREALAQLQAFVAQHPYLVAPNIHRMWQDSLTESAVMLERELMRRQGRPPGGERHG